MVGGLAGGVSRAVMAIGARTLDDGGMIERGRDPSNTAVATVTTFSRSQSATMAGGLSRRDPAVMAGRTGAGFCHAVVVSCTQEGDAVGMADLARLGRGNVIERHRRCDDSASFGMATRTVSGCAFEYAAGVACSAFNDDMCAGQRKSCLGVVKFAAGAFDKYLSIRLSYSACQAFEHLVKIWSGLTRLWFSRDCGVF